MKPYTEFDQKWSFLTTDEGGRAERSPCVPPQSGKVQNEIKHITIVALAAVLAGGASAQYSVTYLEPAGASQSRCFSAYGGVQCGYVDYGQQGNATLWHGTAASQQNIHQGGWISSAANWISGDQVVVSALVSQGQGFLYKISDGSFTNMTGTYPSVGMQGCNGATNTQVGSGLGGMGMGVMVLFNGDPNNKVELMPPGAFSSAGAGCASTYQVGNASAMMGFPFLTHGGADYIDLTPPGAVSAAVHGCDENSQVGGVFYSFMGQGNAVLWHGTAASAVNLHPAWALSSNAAACAGDTQVGAVTDPSGFAHAVVWHNTPDSAVDLHQFLDGQYISSEATGVDPVTGDIVGIAYTQVGFFTIPHAVLWSQPTSETLAPVSQQVQLGQVKAGDLSSLASDDNNAEQIGKFIVPNSTSPFVRVKLNFTTTKASPSSIQVLEKGRLSTGTAGVFVTRSFLFNNQTLVKDLVLADSSMSGSYQSYNATVSGNAIDYVGGGNSIELTFEVQQAGPSSTSLPSTDWEYVNLKVTG